MNQKLWGLLLLSACSTGTVYQRGPISQQLLRPRKGHQDKLTNNRCAEYKRKVCVKWDLVEYDFNDDSVRKMLRDLKFICRVGKSRFVPCPTARGICSLTIKDGGWFNPDEIKLNKYLSLHDDYDFLIASNMECASINSDYGAHMFDD